MTYSALVSAWILLGTSESPGKVVRFPAATLLLWITGATFFKARKGLGEIW